MKRPRCGENVGLFSRGMIFGKTKSWPYSPEAHRGVHKLQRVALTIPLTVLTTASTADALTGRVVGISDSDTLTLLDATNTQYKIRRSGVDSPEKGQAFGQVCKKRLSDLA